jgi:hypothetical protein
MTGQLAPHTSETGAIIPQIVIDMTTFSGSVRLLCHAFCGGCTPRISQIVHNSTAYPNWNTCGADQFECSSADRPDPGCGIASEKPTIRNRLIVPSCSPSFCFGPPFGAACEFGRTRDCYGFDRVDSETAKWRKLPSRKPFKRLKFLDSCLVNSMVASITLRVVH